MESITLTLLVSGLMIIFTVDTIHKRKKFISESKNGV